MIHYSCDVCGTMLPGSYRRPEDAHRLRLADLCQVKDVCPACAKAAQTVSIQQVLLETWKSAVERREDAPSGPVLREHDQKNLAGEKRAILARLKAYRESGGLGSFEALAKLAGADVTPELLQSILTDAPKLPIATWRRIGKALDKLGGET